MVGGAWGRGSGVWCEEWEGGGAMRGGAWRWRGDAGGRSGGARRSCAVLKKYVGSDTIMTCEKCLGFWLAVMIMITISIADKALSVLSDV